MALINLRNALMTGKRLPYDAEVEYLESTGTQYINSGLTVSNALRVKCRVSIEGVCWIFGGRTGRNNKQFSVYQPASTNIRLGYANTSSEKTDSYGVHDIDFNQNAVYFDGALLHTFAASTFSSASPLYIGTLSTDESGTTASQCLIGNIYAFQIYVDGVLVRDFIPVRKGTVGYLYDRVSGKLFGNAGTGDFVLGPDVVPVEYIESHGTEYIDTGVVMSQPSDNSYVETRMSFSSGVGAEGSNGANKYYFLGKSGSSVYFGCGNWATTTVAWNAGQVATLKLSTSGKAFFDGNRIATYNGIVGQTNSFRLFGVNTYVAQFQTSQRKYSFRAVVDGVLVQNLSPVRVGTDATSWEGAMMDVLTRRIYRNAGTGAFGYGNDLKYPIPAE